MIVARVAATTTLALTVGATVFFRPAQDLSDFAGSEPVIYDSRIRNSESSAVEDGLAVQRNTIVVLFRDGATKNDIDALLLRYELTPRALMEAPLLYVVESPPGQALEAESEAARLRTLVERLRGEQPLVVEAVQNTYLEPTVVPATSTNPDITWDWHSTAAMNGVEALREMYFPEAWNFRTVMSHRINVGVLDFGFDFASVTPHDDLFLQNFTHSDCIERQDVHGQAVAGIIGAGFDNGTGIDGASPVANVFVCATRSGTSGSVTDVSSTSTADAPLLRRINALTSHLHGLEILLKAGMPVINVSMGYNWYLKKLEADTNPDIQRLVKAQGTMVLALVRTYPTSMIVTAAGNECEPLTQLNPPPARCDRDAKWASPLNWAALAPPSATRAENIIVVEAADIRGNPLLLSNTGGTIAAIGQQVGATSIDNGYGICPDSTSCAAPFVTATLSMMLAYNPKLTIAELRANLLQSTGSGRLLNAFKAVAASHPDAPADLANLDGTGGVDLDDFERFRNAFRQVTSGTFTDDLNEDGTPDLNDSRFPRADLNGDGQISATAKSFVPNIGDVTDLEVMMHVWADTTVDKSTLPAKLLE